MNWVLIGFLLGSQITSQHETREACEGRAVLLREKGAVAIKCIEVQTFTAPQYIPRDCGIIFDRNGKPSC